ncbi:MAG: hypothetical protein OXT67_13065 [Zetaproteobacteria bacterium]|nr:hypothetical protein [Zetaproteobacteria bacterium]
MKKNLLDAYLRRYSEHIPSFAEWFTQQGLGPWQRYTVVPVCDECEDTPRLLASLVQAAQGWKVLLVFVLNQRQDAELAIREGNRRWSYWLQTTLTGVRVCASGWVGTLQGVDVAVIDCTTAQHMFPPKSGVGLARKLGMDFGVWLFAKGLLRTQWMSTTDADALLPMDYFHPQAWEHPQEVAGMVFPYVHVNAPNMEVQRVLGGYQAMLDGYVDGLCRAGSPYAFHTLGSTIFSSVVGYVQVRGMPDLQAGEDFHFLCKLRKVGKIVGGDFTPIQLQARLSRRVPFGTGQALAEWVRTGRTSRPVYAPVLFEQLAILLRYCEGVLAGCAATPVCIQDCRAVVATKFWEAFVQACVGVRVQDFLNKTQATGLPVVQKRKRFHDWFDGLKTLRWLRLLRDSGVE